MSTVSASIPVERLWELYDYNPFTGKLIHRRLGHTVKGSKGKSCLNICIRHEGRKINTNYGRIVYAWCVGQWPEDVDHKNHDWHDNRIHNLRSLTHRQNCQNKRNHKGGAVWDKSRNRWKTEIQINGRKKFLGRYHTKEEAQAAYRAACGEVEKSVE